MSQTSIQVRAHRPVVMGTNGMVASAHPLASVAGLRVLMEGGNAMDAAVTVGATPGVVEPYMSGPGGIGVLLVYIAREGRIRALDFSGRAPHAARPELYNEETKGLGVLAPLVPGNVAGWLTLHEAYGTMDRERLLEPAIAYARDGFPLTYNNHRFFANNAARVSRFPTSRAILLPNGQPPAPGTIFRQPQLAATLQKVAKGGMETFYRGEVARQLARACKEMGGLITEEDLAQYQAQWQEPISVSYRGYQVNTVPPNSSGFQILQTLKLMETYPSPELSFGTPETLHRLMEAIKLCVTDRIRFAGDPDYVDIPLRALLSQGYALAQRKRIDENRAAIVMGERYTRTPPAGALAPGRVEDFSSGMTTHFAVADRDGNVVSVTQTLGGGFGSAVAMGDTGVFLNNMAWWFETDPASGSPNVIGPWKRVDFCVAPVQVLRGGQFYLSLSTPGSWGILQTTPQMLMNVLDFGMTVQEAIEAPRFRYWEGTRVEMEERFPPQVRQALERLGHNVQVLEAWSPVVGGAQGILVDVQTGAFHGGADPRRDGYAIGW